MGDTVGYMDRQLVYVDRLLVYEDRLLVYEDCLLLCGDRLLVYEDCLLVCGDQLLVRGPSARAGTVCSCLETVQVCARLSNRQHGPLAG